MPVSINKILMIKRFLCIVCFFSLSIAFSNATNIKGQVEIDDSWEALIYLSVINSFDDLNTASYDFLIAQAANPAFEEGRPHSPSLKSFLPE